MASKLKGKIELDRGAVIRHLRCSEGSVIPDDAKISFENEKLVVQWFEEVPDEEPSRAPTPVVPASRVMILEDPIDDEV